MKGYVPGVSSKPLRLASRLLLHRNPSARSALLFAAGGMLLSPLDALLQRQEERVYRNLTAKSPKMIIVCGPPRSGTTLVAQYLINSMKVSYINNLTSLFPKSPLLVNRWFNSVVQPRVGNYKAYYGRSQGLAGANDGLHLWDRWLGVPRDDILGELQPEAETGVRRFFSGWQNEFGEPTVNKVNRLIGCLDLVAPILPDSFFIYLRRDPVMLAQSLLIARSEIACNLRQNYGIKHPNRCFDDPVEDVCRQVEFYMQLEEKFANGPFKNRIAFVDYEEFCSNPHQLLDKLESALPFSITKRGVLDRNLSFKVSRKSRLPEAQLGRIRQRFAMNKQRRSQPRPLHQHE